MSIGAGSEHYRRSNMRGEQSVFTKVENIILTLISKHAWLMLRTLKLIALESTSSVYVPIRRM